MDRLLASARLVKKDEIEVPFTSLYTSGRMQVAAALKPRAEFFPGSFREFRFQVVREAEDFELLMSRLGSRARK